MDTTNDYDETREIALRKAIGVQLREARESLGWSRQDVVARLQSMSYERRSAENDAATTTAERLATDERSCHTVSELVATILRGACDTHD